MPKKILSSKVSRLTTALGHTLILRAYTGKNRKNRFLAMMLLFYDYQLGMWLVEYKP